MLSAAKKYIDDQIAIYEKIQASFPVLHMGDDHVMVGVHNMYNDVRETLRVLYEVKSEAKSEKSIEGFKEALDELYAWYRGKLKKEVENDEKFGICKDIGRVSVDVREARISFDVIRSISSFIRSMELKEYAE